MEIEQVIKISQLYDFYSELLSEKQKQEIFSKIKELAI